MKYSKLRCADFLHEGQLVSVEVADMPSAPCQTISNQPPPARQQSLSYWGLQTPSFPEP